MTKIDDCKFLRTSDTLTGFPATQGNQGNQGIWVSVFPVRENSGNLRKTANLRENSGKNICSDLRWKVLEQLSVCLAYIVCQMFTFIPWPCWLPLLWWVFNVKVFLLPPDFDPKPHWSENISQGILKNSQGNIREISGNFVFIECWEPCDLILKSRSKMADQRELWGFTILNIYGDLSAARSQYSVTWPR